MKLNSIWALYLQNAYAVFLHCFCFPSTQLPSFQMNTIFLNKTIHKAGNPLLSVASLIEFCAVPKRFEHPCPLGISSIIWTIRHISLPMAQGDDCLRWLQHTRVRCKQWCFFTSRTSKTNKTGCAKKLLSTGERISERNLWDCLCWFVWTSYSVCRIKWFRFTMFSSSVNNQNRNMFDSALLIVLL